LAQTVLNVSAGKPRIGGAIFRAPLGTTLPTNATSTLNSSFISQGYCSEDGLTNSNSPESQEVKAWGGDTVMNVQTGKKDQYKTTFLESLYPEVLKTIFGPNNVSGTLETGISVEANADEAEEYVWVFDMNMRGGALKRIVLPDAKIIEVGDVNYRDDKAAGYPVTLSALPDASGNTHYEYIIRQTTAVSLDKSTASVAVGSTTSLTATTTPSGGTVTWATSDATVATVSGGTVTGVATGTATITASYQGKTATCTVTVTAA